ncbi:reverse transcriptase domain-containing protein [Methylophaga sp.]|uniref:reverse transcriptase domain-containing protein n=1 Tax=Methylophaga sp. TaxID=2024840 RepID=UPI003A8DD609
MSKRTLKEAFNAVFHDQNAYDDFRSSSLNAEIEQFQINQRTVIRQSKKLKTYLRFINKVLFRHLAKNTAVVHSFIKDKNTLTAVSAHAENKYFFLTDIASFYQNIKKDDVKNILLRDQELIPISDIAEHLDFLSEITTYDDSLPVGYPTSPELSNAFLYDFDCAIKAFCDSESLVYTRYADDIIISGQRFEELSSLKQIVQEALHQHASDLMYLNEQKTLITSLGNKVKILGLVILPNGQITIDKKYKTKLETLLYFYSNDKTKYADYLKHTMDGKERSLFGLLHYANSVDPKYIKKLQRKYGVLTLRSLMEEKLDD